MTPTLQISTYEKSRNVRLSWNDDDAYLLSDLGVLRLIEALWSLVPIGADSLARQLYFVLVFLDYFAQAEVGYLDLPVVEYYVLWLQIVVNDFLFLVSQVL